MNTNEIVKSLLDAYCETDPVYFFLRTLLKEAADEIERLQKELDATKADFEIIKGCGVYGKNHYGCQSCKNSIKNGGKCRHMSCGGFEWRGITNE